MARVHRPPPPVPMVEQEEDNYGVWSDSEFDDPADIYENTEDPKVEGDSDDDYEQPDDPVPASTAAHPVPNPAAPAIPPIPPRHGFRPAPSPASLMPESRAVKAISPKPSPKASPRASPLPPAPVEDEETYEAVDDLPSPPMDDDGEVYEVVDDSPVLLKPKNCFRPVPQPGDGGLRAHPQIPLPNFQQKETPSRKSSQPEIKRAASPNLPRRDMPLPPPVKLAPPGRAPPVIQKPSPQPSPPPSPETEMYTATDFYADAERDSPPPPLPGGLAKNAKPLPKPPCECDGDDEDNGDQFYEAVPETKTKPWKAKADRPIPPVPQPQTVSTQPTPFSGSGTLSRFPVEKLQAELARFAGASKKTSKPEPVADVVNSSLSLGNMSPVNPVSRGESLNTAEKPKLLPSVKRAESDSTKRLETDFQNGDRKVSKVSETVNKFQSDNKQPEKHGVHLSPMFPKKEPYSADTSGNRNTPQMSRIKPTQPVPSEVPIKKPAVAKPETSETLSLPRVPMPRASPARNYKEEANSKGTNSPAESKSTPNDKRALPKPPTNELGGLYSYGWYFSDIERDSAEEKIKLMKQDGAYLVRKSKRGGERNPYTLTLLYCDYIYNLHIRRRPDQKYALGTEKPDEHVFSSVEDLVSFHANNPIEVVGDARKNAAPGRVVLRAFPKK